MSLSDKYKTLFLVVREVMYLYKTDAFLLWQAKGTSNWKHPVQRLWGLIHVNPQLHL